MLRSLVEGSRSPTGCVGETRTVEDKLVLTRFNEGEDIEAYLTTFQRLMTVYGIAENRWAIKLAPQLAGHAQEAYAVLSTVAAADYKEVKKAILKRYDIGEETYDNGSGPSGRKTVSLMWR